MSNSNVTSKSEKSGEGLDDDMEFLVFSESDLTSNAKENIDFAVKDDKNSSNFRKEIGNERLGSRSTYEKIMLPARLLNKFVNILFRGKWKLITLNYFERFFMLYSRFVFRNSLAVIIVATLICLILGIGKFKVNYRHFFKILSLNLGHLYRHPVEDSERQFALPNSKAKNDEQFYNSAFPGARTRHEIVIFKAIDSGSVITEENLHIIKSFHEGLMNVTFTLGEEDARSLLDAYNELRNSTSSKQRATEEKLTNITNSQEEGNNLRSILEYPINKMEDMQYIEDMEDIEDIELYERKLLPALKYGFGNNKRNINKKKANNRFNYNSTKPKIEKHYLDTKMFTSNEYIPPDFFEDKDPHSGKIVKKYRFNFSHVCARVQGGSCRRPSGILWMYKYTKDFGKPIPTPYVINTLTYQSFRTDMWLSPIGMEHDKRSEHVKSSRAAIIEYQLSDQDQMKKFSFLWEEEFMKYCEKVQRRLQKGDYGDDLKDGSNFFAFVNEMTSNSVNIDKRNNEKDFEITYNDPLSDEIDEVIITDDTKISKNKTYGSSMPNIKRITKGATKYLFKGDSTKAPLSIYYNARRALSDELTEQTYIHTPKDFAIIGSLVVILLIYGWTVGYGSNLYTSRATSGVCGAIAALLAYIGGAGLCYFAGLEHTSTASAAPFLVLGVGMDDSFVVINSFNMTYPLKNAEDRIVSSIRDCGLSISLTTLTNLLSFAIGTSAGYLAIRNFCILTFVGLLFGYITCLTILLGVLCIDARIEENKMLKIFGKEFFANHKLPDPLEPEIDVPIEKFSTVALIGFLVSQYKQENKKKLVDNTKELLVVEEDVKSIKDGTFNDEIEMSKSIHNNLGSMSIDNSIERFSKNEMDIDDNFKYEFDSKLSEQNENQNQTINTFKFSNTAFGEETSKLKIDESFDTQKRDYSRQAACSNLEIDSSIKEEFSKENRENSLRMIDCIEKKQNDTKKDEIETNKKRNNKERNENDLGTKLIPNMAEILDTRLLNYKRGRSNVNSSIQLTENIEISDYNTEQLKRNKKIISNEMENSSLSSPKTKESYTLKDDFQDPNVLTSNSISLSNQTSSSELSVFPMEARQNIGRKSRRFVIKYYATFLTMTSTRVVILILASIFLGVSIYSSIQLKMGLDLKILAPPTSQVYKFYVNHEKLFNKYGDVTFLMFQASREAGDEKSNVWWDNEFKSKYKELQKQVHNAWFTEIKLDGMSAFYDSLLIKGLPNNSIEYSKMLKAFISSPYNRHFEDDFVFNPNTGELEAWRSILIPIYLHDTSVRGKYMMDIRKIIESIQGINNPIAYSPLFIFYESDVSILPQTLYNMGCALIAVLLASLILMPSISSVVIVIIILCMVDVCIIGMMAQWGLQLNMLTMVNLIMSIGISVDYSTHICHCFAHCSGSNRNTRVIETLGLMGIPIFHGAMSTQFAVTVLAFSDSYVLQTFYKMMTLVVCIGICYGAIILPVILTIFGPMDVIKYTKAHHKQMNKEEH